MLKKTGFMIAGLVALPLFLAGCGGDESNKSAPSATPSNSGAQNSGAPSPGALVTEHNQPTGAPKGPPAGPGDRGKVLKYAQCMRANGVKNFPDPDANGAIQMNGDVVNPTSPEFQKAQEKCGSLMPGSGGPTSISTRGPNGGS